MTSVGRSISHIKAEFSPTSPSPQLQLNSPLLWSPPSLLSSSILHNHTMTLPPRSDSESQDRDNQHDEQPHDVNDGQEYPELDEFVGEFRDGTARSCFR
ncbi:hypothetical protein B0O80DRAFT_432458, partial [Mortierella sp. GBAus27b]